MRTAPSVLSGASERPTPTRKTVLRICCEHTLDQVLSPIRHVIPVRRGKIEARPLDRVKDGAYCRVLLQDVVRASHFVLVKEGESALNNLAQTGYHTTKPRE